MHHEPVIAYWMYFSNYSQLSSFKVLFSNGGRGRKKERLTAFCPSTAQRIPSDAFARHARIIYVGSIYLTSTGTPNSLKCFFVWKKNIDGYRYQIFHPKLWTEWNFLIKVNYPNIQVILINRNKNAQWLRLIDNKSFFSFLFSFYWKFLCELGDQNAIYPSGQIGGSKYNIS